jgi:hypothetical protein
LREQPLGRIALREERLRSGTTTRVLLRSYAIAGVRILVNGSSEADMKATHRTWTALATRVPKALHARVKSHCTAAGRLRMHFIVAAIEEKLTRERGCS